MAGIPPFIGFFAKLFVLFSSISVSQYFLVIIGIIVSVISTYYYLRIIKVLYTEDTNISNIKYNTAIAVHGNNFIAKKKNLESYSILTNIHSLIIAILSLFLLLFFLILKFLFFI